jgi:hypothetical protein
MLVINYYIRNAFPSAFNRGHLADECISRRPFPSLSSGLFLARFFSFIARKIGTRGRQREGLVADIFFSPWRLKKFQYARNMKKCIPPAVNR